MTPVRAWLLLETAHLHEHVMEERAHTSDCGSLSRDEGMIARRLRKTPLTTGSARPSPHRCRKAELQSVRRLRNKARLHLQRTLLACVRAGIFPLSSYGQLPEVVRMSWLLSQCHRNGWNRETSAAAVLIDCAARSPQFTSAAAAVVRRTRHRTGGRRAVNRLLSLHRSRTWSSFWKGRSTAVVTALRSWSATDVLRVAKRLAQGGRHRRTHELLEQLRTLRGIGPYLSLGMMRIILASMSPGPMRGSAGAAVCMSDHVQVLHEVLSFRDAQHYLLASGVAVARSWDCSFLAYLFCEVAKVLRYAEVVAPLYQYRGQASMLQADLASCRCRDFLLHLEALLGCLPDVSRCSPEIVETARTLGLSQHSMVQVQALSVYRHLCTIRPEGQ